MEDLLPPQRANMEHLLCPPRPEGDVDIEGQVTLAACMGIWTQHAAIKLLLAHDRLTCRAGLAVIESAALNAMVVRSHGQDAGRAAITQSAPATLAVPII